MSAVWNWFSYPFIRNEVLKNKKIDADNNPDEINIDFIVDSIEGFSKKKVEQGQNISLDDHVNIIEQEKQVANVSHDDTPQVTEDDLQKLITEKKIQKASKRREKRQRQREEEKQRTIQEKNFLAKSIVFKPISDPLDGERQELLNSINKKLNDFLESAESALDKSFDRQKEVTTFCENLENDLRRESKILSKKINRVDSSIVYIGEQKIKDSIMELEKNGSEKNADAIYTQYNNLCALVYMNNNKSFMKEVNALIEKIQNLPKTLDLRLDELKYLANKKIAFNQLKSFDTLINESDLVCSNFDASVSAKKLMNITKKIEKKFNVVLFRNRNVFAIWGKKENVQNAKNWLEKIDFSLLNGRMLNLNFIKALSGRNQTRSDSFEKKNDCIIHFDKSNLVTVYGTTDNIRACWIKIDEFAANYIHINSNYTYHLDPFYLRFLFKKYENEIKEIETNFKCQIRLSYSVDDSNSGMIIKCNKEHLEQIKDEIQNKILSNYEVLVFDITPSCLSRLTRSTQKGYSETLYKQFTELIQQYSLSYEKGENSESLYIICSIDYVNEVKTKIEKLIDQADYTNKVIEIEPQHSRLFNESFRTIFESKMHCKISSNAKNHVLIILGKDYLIDQAIKYVEDYIKEFGYTDSYNITSNELVKYLLADQGKVIKDIQLGHNAILKIDRPANQINIMAQKDKIQKIFDEIDEIAMEIGDIDIREIEINDKNFENYDFDFLKKSDGFKSIQIESSDGLSKIILKGTPEFLDISEKFLKNDKKQESIVYENSSGKLTLDMTSEVDFPKL